MSSFKKNAFTYAIIVALGGFIFGLDAALISGTINYLVQEFSLSDLELGTVVSASGFGVLFALPFAGYASNLFGRKKTLIIIAAVYVLSAIFSAMAPSYWALVFARFLGGLAFTSITMASMYIGEIAPAKYRGKLVSMIQINIVIGLTLAYFANYFIQHGMSSGADWAESLGLADNTWRWMLGVEIIPALLWFLLLFIIPNSPSWLIYKGRIQEAKTSLKKLLPIDEIEDYVLEKQESLGNNTESRSIVSQLLEILGKPMRITFIIALTFAIAQQATGINAILFYAPVVFEQVGLGTDASFVQAIWIGLSSLFFTVLSLMLIDKLGRRPLVIWGMLWIILSLGVCSYGFYNARYTLTEAAISGIEIQNKSKLDVLIGIEFSSDIEFKEALTETLGVTEARNASSILLQKATQINASLILFGILSFIAAFHFSVGPIMWVLFSEMFPISLRGIAIPLFALVTSITSYLVQQFFPWQLATMGASSIFLFYAAMVGVGLVILFRYLPETKNLSIEEIQLALQPKEKRKIKIGVRET